MGRRRGTSAFPVARIKKMMQSDDDVGKIATVTPMLVAKALECMMELVLTEAASVARDRRSRTLTPLHLKHTVMRNDDFDFLRPVFSAVDGALDDTAPAPRARADPQAAAAHPAPGAHPADRPVSPAPRPRRRRSTATHAGTKRPRTPARSDVDDAPPLRRGRGRPAVSVGAAASASTAASLSRLPALPGDVSPSAAAGESTGVGNGASSSSAPAAAPAAALVQHKLQALPPLQALQSLPPLQPLQTSQPASQPPQQPQPVASAPQPIVSHAAVPPVAPPLRDEDDEEEDYDADDADGEETEPALPEPTPPKADRVAVHALLS